MMPIHCLKYCILLLAQVCLLMQGHAAVRLKAIARFSGVQENPLTGYGLVVGLSGSGDSQRNKNTMQALSNALQTFGINIPPHEINSRNAATVMVSAMLPAFTQQGDKIDIHVASLGDAKSLLGGTLVTTPLRGADNNIYALAQGSISIGGFKYDHEGNTVQKNHPTTGLIPNGALIEQTLNSDMMDKKGNLHLILNYPDFTTAHYIEKIINKRFGAPIASARSAQDIDIHLSTAFKRHLVRFISDLERLIVTPDYLPRVVINERTGVIVAGSDVTINAVTISHGALDLTVTTDYNTTASSLWYPMHKQTRLIPKTQVKEAKSQIVKLPQGATVADLMHALTKARCSIRDMITILESLKRAEALHAELIIQ